MSERRLRPRDHGIEIGLVSPGAHNSITDVPGLRVGHVTLAEQCTGVTAIVPDLLPELYQRPLAAGMAVLNGAGELTGSLTMNEWGTLETPVLLTATMSVGVAYQAVVEEMMAEVPAVADDVVIPVIGECDDSWLHDPRAGSISVADARAAIRGATAGPMAAGCVGGGAGMMCLGWKGGIGTSSRRVDDAVVGVLAMTNFGSLERLCVDGHHVGRRFVELGRRGWREAPEGSCIVIIATDAPLLPAQCQRVARRAGLGLARTGSVGTHGSGEIFAAFSTTCRLDRSASSRIHHDVVADRHLNELFAAVVEATEEAVIDSMFRATTTIGRGGHVAEALPVDELLAAM